MGRFDPAPDAVVINGDIVNHGFDAEYDLIETLAAEAGRTFPGDFILVMGDHEQWGTIRQGGPADYAGQREAFLRRAGLSRLYYDTYVNDQHVAVLGPDADPRRWDTLNFSGDQLQWLDALLAADADAGVRTFVFMHAPANDTVAYTFEGQLKRDTLDASAAFMDVVSKYPQAIVVSSHTHSLPDFQRPNPQGPLFVSTGAVAYLRPDAHTDWSDAGLAYSHGLLVDIYRNRTEFTPWDFVMQAAADGGYTMA
jgi:3',5'-cyclic AMP phosphodiesterase CpdA